jgi:predicted O-methyltransferase YrrM
MKRLIAILRLSVEVSKARTAKMAGKMLRDEDHAEIVRLWTRKIEQDQRGLPQSDRHRNLEPTSAEFICALAAGIGAQRILEIGGSSGISTIALASAVRQTRGA